MNIFAFDPDPWTCALWLDDIRKNKMILETAQLLSSAAFLLDPKATRDVYKPTHLTILPTRWALTSKANFNWLIDHMECLYEQQGGPHKSALLIPTFKSLSSSLPFPLDKQTPFANCASNKDKGLDFTHIKDTHQAYRLYMVERWKETTIPLSWANGQQPDWRQ